MALEDYDRGSFIDNEERMLLDMLEALYEIRDILSGKASLKLADNANASNVEELPVKKYKCKVCDLYYDTPIQVAQCVKKHNKENKEK